MKNSFLFLCLAPLLGGTMTFAQMVTTDPVGFINETVGGAINSAPQYTFISPTLTQPIVFQGTIASFSGTNSTTINVTGASWTAGPGFNVQSGSYYVEVFSATKPGALSDITATGTSSVTTVDNLSSFAAASDSIRIRQHVTIATLLGATNTYGLLGSTSVSSADQVLLYDGGTHLTYFYYTGGSGISAGWIDQGFNDISADGTTPTAGSVTIAPHEGVMIRRIGSGTVTITSTGTVKTGNTLFPIYTGYNVLGTVAAQGLTLDSSGLYQSDGSALQASTNPNTADTVIIYTGGVPTTYFYYAGGSGISPGWIDQGFNDLSADGTTPTAGSVAIAPGTSFFVRRRNGAAFNWTVPSPTSF